MLRKSIISFLLVSFLAGQSFAGNGKDKRSDKGTCVLTGKVLDKLNAEALPGATVTIKELGITTYADLNGAFSFNNVPEGNYTIEIAYVSYIDNKSEGVSVSANSNLKKFFLSSL